MDTCLNIEKTYQELLSVINNSGLSVGTALFVLKDIYNSLNLAFEAEKKREYAIQQQAQVEKENEELAQTEEG